MKPRESSINNDTSFSFRGKSSSDLRNRFSSDKWISQPGIETFADPNKAKPGDRIILGYLFASRLGDVICTTPLPRMLTQKYGWRIYVPRHRSTMGIFLNNPYVCGFTTKRGISLHNELEGSGHLIQRLQRGFGLTEQTIPKPEIYLSRPEIEWAMEERQKWPQDRPVCILSTRVITDNSYYDFSNINWDAITSSWSNVCTIVQPVLTNQKHYEKYIGNLTRKVQRQWRPEPIFANAIVYKNLSLRQYMSLFAVAHYYCGGTSGGAHIAAAFNMPSLIMIWRSLIVENLWFPCHGRKWNTLNFLYPQHHFILAEDCEKSQGGYKWLDKAIEVLVDEKAEVSKLDIIERPRDLSD